MKIFFEKFNTPFNTLPFGQWKVADYLPAAKHAIKLAQEKITQLKESTAESNFRDFLLPYIDSTKELDLIAHTFFNLHSANTNDEMNQVAQELSPLLTEFSNDLLLDPELFRRVKETYDRRESQGLSIEEQTILTDQHKSFIRNGALLGAEDKQHLRKVDEQLAKLSVDFGRNALESVNQFVISIREDDLKGIPKENWDIFKNAAKEKNRSGFAVTFDLPVYLPFMKGCENRALREKLYSEFVQTATRGQFDNRRICQKIIHLRKKRAEILGHPNHASFVLDRRMAKTPQEVMDFLQDLKNKAQGKAYDEIKQLAGFAKKRDSIVQLRPWDFNFYGEKYKKELLDFDDEMLRPYFQLENVTQGVFDLASRLYQLRFQENHNIPKYHEEVKTYEVIDRQSSEVCGILYADFFPRPEKRQGAWMCAYQNQSETQIPHIAIVCNFTKSTDSRPSLLTHGEVLTLFHEFGHALHGLLSKCKYRVLSGPQVYWDFVELPSQIMENWAFEKECLDLFAKHYQTGELIPSSIIEKIKKSQTFLAGYATMRQLSFATLDMILHTMDPSQLSDIIETESNIMQEFDLFRYRLPGTSQCTTFSHIFNGGYDAGYYSYKWAEVLDADAFELFKERGVFDTQTAQSFRENILAKGGTEHPMVLYERFRGHRPKVLPLLKRCGLS